MNTKIYKNSRAILIYKNKELIKEVSSISEAAKFIGSKTQNVYKAISGYKTRLNGYTLIKADVTIQDILRQIIGHKNYIFNIDNQNIGQLMNRKNGFIEYGDLKCNNGEFYIEIVGTISFDEILTIMRDKKIEFILE